VSYFPPALVALGMVRKSNGWGVPNVRLRVSEAGESVVWWVVAWAASPLPGATVGVPLPVPTCTDSAPTRASTDRVPLMRHRAPPLTALRPRSVPCSNVKALMEEVLETEAWEHSGVSAELERTVRAH